MAIIKSTYFSSTNLVCSCRDSNENELAVGPPKIDCVEMASVVAVDLSQTFVHWMASHCETHHLRSETGIGKCSPISGQYCLRLIVSWNAFGSPSAN